MTKKELIELYYEVDAACDERRRLGEFDANSKYIMLLLDSLRAVLANAVEAHPEKAEVKRLPPPKKKGKRNA